MRRLQVLIVAALCAGCAKAGPEFVQDPIRIATPVKKRETAVAADGGTVFTSDTRGASRSCAALCAGCAKAGPEFVQDPIRIATPVKKRETAVAADGGTVFT